MESENKNEPIGRVSDKELQKVALEELNENPEEKDEAIKAIRLWLDEINYTKRNDYKFILTYLRACKFDQEMTKKKLQTYINIRRDYPHWFSWKDPTSPSMEHLFDLGIYPTLQYNTLTGTKVSMFRIGEIDAEAVFEDVLSLERMVFEVILLDEQTQILGADLIADMSKFGFGQLKHYTPSVIITYAKFMDTFACRVKGLHLLHMPFIFRSLLTVAKLFLSKKLKDRIHIHRDVESLHKLVSPASLPEEYGGTAGPLSTFLDSTREGILRNKEHLQGICENSD